MTRETISATVMIDAAPETVFAVLADPAQHPGIDGTGWLRESRTTDPVTASGQLFGMAMYHELHPDKDYEIVNLVTVFDAPKSIAWEPGQYGPDGELSRGGWCWRYDLRPVDSSRTEVTLTYDWSGATPEARRVLEFPPFPPEHLDRSLANLGRLATSA